MEDFLRAIWSTPSGYGELRAIKAGTVEQDFFDLSDKSAIKDAVDTALDVDGQGWDVYFGIVRRVSKSGNAASVADHSPVLWADIDAKANDDPLQSALRFPISPSIIVDSGHGIHAYWLLREATLISQATLAMRGIAKVIGGDHTYDAARILRIPGTHNHKNGDAVPVRLLRLDITRRYRFSDFSEYTDLGGEKRGTPPSWGAPAPYTGPTEGQPGWMIDLLQSSPPKGSRSEECFRAVAWLVRNGWRDESIRDTLMVAPLGERYRENPRKLDVDIRKARETAI